VPVCLQGEIYIRFVDVPSAVKAVAGLNGRWFGGKQIEATHLPDVMFDARRV
jgi:RNA-binding protein 39